MTFHPTAIAMLYSYGLLPLLLFATNSHQFHLNTVLEIPIKPMQWSEYCIHTPHRILSQIGCMYLVPNSTSPPIQTGT